MLQHLEPTKEQESETLPQGESLVAMGALALMDWVEKLKETPGAYISQFISDGSHSKFDLVRPVVDGLTPPSLTPPMETVEEECSSDTVHDDLARLQHLLEKTPLDNGMIVKQVKFLVAECPKLHSQLI